jgi:cell division protease FtsH
MREEPLQLRRAGDQEAPPATPARPVEDASRAPRRPRLPHGRQGKLLVVLAVAVALGAGKLALAAVEPTPPEPPTKTFTGVLERIRDGKVAEVTIDAGALTITVDERDRGVPDYRVGLPGIAGNEQLLDTAEAADVPVTAVPATGEGLLYGLLKALFPVLIIAALIVFLMRKQGLIGGAGSFSRAERPAVTFADVAGCGEAVEELADVREFLKHPRRFAELGARVPKGVLLHGQPGTGKTLLAKAVAAEAGVPFFAVAGSDFVQMFAGIGAARIRSLFAEAKKQAPSIVFIDELDAVGRARGGGADGGAREADQTLTQLLTELDGFTPSKHPVIVMAASNHPELLDPALTRPGRFDRQVSIDPPDKAGRRQILAVHAKGKALGDDVDLDRLAEQTSGMSGAELANIINETLLHAARRGAARASAADLEDAFMRVVAGAAKQSRAMSAADRRAVAYHEAGHALVGERLAAADKVHKISIVPRGRSGGQTILVSEEDVFLHTEQDILDRIAWTLAGRAAEQIALGRVTTGAADDLQRTTDLAMQLTGRFGMGSALGLRVATDKHPLSPTAAAERDREVDELLAAQLQRAVDLLTEDREALERVAQALLAEEVVDRDRFLALLALG